MEQARQMHAIMEGKSYTKDGITISADGHHLLVERGNHRVYFIPHMGVQIHSVLSGRPTDVWEKAVDLMMNKKYQIPIAVLQDIDKAVRPHSVHVSTVMLQKLMDCEGKITRYEADMLMVDLQKEYPFIYKSWNFNLALAQYESWYEGLA